MSDSTKTPWVSVSPWTGGEAALRRLSQEEIQEPSRWLYRNRYVLFALTCHLPIAERGIAIGGMGRHDILAVGRFKDMRSELRDTPDVFYGYIRDPDVIYF